MQTENWGYFTHHSGETYKNGVNSMVSKLTYGLINTSYSCLLIWYERTTPTTKRFCLCIYMHSVNTDTVIYSNLWGPMKFVSIMIWSNWINKIRLYLHDNSPLSLKWMPTFVKWYLKWWVRSLDPTHLRGNWYHQGVPLTLWSHSKKYIFSDQVVFTCTMRRQCSNQENNFP